MLKTLSKRDDLVRALRENEKAIRRFGVRRLGLFGSFQRDAVNAESDVDLLVEFEPGHATFDHFMGLSFFCDELFGRKVEIVTPGSLSPCIGPRIHKEVEYVLR